MMMNIIRCIPTYIWLYMFLGITSVCYSNQHDHDDIYYNRPEPIFFQGHLWNPVLLSHHPDCECESEDYEPYEMCD